MPLGENMQNSMKNKPTYGVILAGGVGKRMKADIPKQFILLNGKPILYYSIKEFVKSSVDEIIIVVDEKYKKECEKIVETIEEKKKITYVKNGEERVFSVLNALKYIKEKEEKSFVLIHDGARPFIKKEVIEELIEKVKKDEAVILGTFLKETIKEKKDNKIIKTIDRNNYILVKTPEAFSFETLYKAYEKWEEDEKKFIPTDDASLVEEYGNVEVTFIESDEKNIKITTPNDLIIARVYLEAGFFKK